MSRPASTWSGNVGKKDKQNHWSTTWDCGRCRQGCDRVRKNADLVVGEEATKQQLILPFLQALGYDIWEPSEVIAESISDVATKKKAGHLNKVDYAIAIKNTIVMVVEAKARKENQKFIIGHVKELYSSTFSAKSAFVRTGLNIIFHEFP